MKPGDIRSVWLETGWIVVKVLSEPFATQAQSDRECEEQRQLEQEELAERFPKLPRRNDVERAIDEVGE